MRGLSYRKGQQQHLLHITLIIGVHGAEELLTVDRECFIKVGPNKLEMKASFC